MNRWLALISVLGLMLKITVAATESPRPLFDALHESRECGERMAATREAVEFAAALQAAAVCAMARVTLQAAVLRTAVPHPADLPGASLRTGELPNDASVSGNKPGRTWYLMNLKENQT